MQPEIKRSSQEIQDQLDLAERMTDDLQRSRFPELTYEHGVIDAIRWLLGEEDDSPMGDIDDAL